MNCRRPYRSILAIGCCFLLCAGAQGKQGLAQTRGPLTEAGYAKSAAAVVKVLANGGQKVGAGVIVGIQKDGGGVVLTSYSVLAGQAQVDILAQNSYETLVGEVYNRWIDLDLDIAMILVPDFPVGSLPISFKQEKFGLVGDTFTIIGHAADQDWGPIEVQISDENDKRLECSLGRFTGIDGAPVVNEDGNMIALIVSDAVQESTGHHVALAVKTKAIKPVVERWLSELSLRSQWREHKGGVAPWVWALSGSVVGGGVAAAIVLAGSGSESPMGLPRPPLPPENR